MNKEVVAALATLKADPLSGPAVATITKWANGPFDKDVRQDVVDVLNVALRNAKQGPAELPLQLALASAHAQRGEAGEAEANFRKVRRLAPGHAKVVDFYRAYHTGRGEFAQLLGILAAAQKAEDDIDLKIVLGMEIAELAEARVPGSDKAIDAWKAVLRLRPGFPEATAALRRLYTKAEKWNALLEMLKEDIQALPAGAVQEKIARYQEMVPIYRDRLKLDVMVANVYSAILALRGDDTSALSALGGQYEAEGRWADLIQILTKQAQSDLPAAKKVELYRRIAGLWLDKLNRQQNAVAILEKAWELMPGDEATGTLLKDILTRERSWRALLDVMQRELSDLAPSVRRDHLSRMAKLTASEIGDRPRAIGLWNDVLAIAPSDADALEALAALYEAEERWNDLVEILGCQAEEQKQDKQRAAELRERQGILLMEKLGEWQAARQSLVKAQALQPDRPATLHALRDVYVNLHDLEALEALYVARGAFGELADVLTGVAERTEEVAVRIDILARVAGIASTHLLDPQRALRAYESIVASDAGNLEAMRALLVLYRDLEMWPRELATIETLLAPRAGGTARERLQLAVEASRVCENKMGSKALAFQWCVRAHDLDPTDADVFSELLRLGEEAEEWVALTPLVATRAASAVPAKEKIDLFRRLMRACLQKLNRPDEARGHAEAIAALAPGDAEADAVLDDVYTQQGRWNELVTLLQRRLEQVSVKEERTVTLFRIAAIAGEKLADHAAAAVALRAIVKADEDNARAWRALEKVLEAQGDWPGVAASLRVQAQLQQADERVRLLVRLGGIEEKHLDDRAGARQSLCAALDIDHICLEAVTALERMLAEDRGGGHIPKTDVVPAAVRLCRYYELGENYHKWAATLETLLEADEASDSDQRWARLETLTDLYVGPLADGASAFGAALRMMDLAPDDGNTRRRLLGMAADSPDLLDRLVEALQRLLVQTSEPALRIALLSDAGEAEERRPGHAADAETVYRKILVLDPFHAGAFRALTRMFHDAERWRDVRDLLNARQAVLTDSKERLPLLNQIAEIDENLVGDREHAVATLRTLLELDPADIRALRTLARQFEELAQWRNLAGTLDRLAALVSAAESLDARVRQAGVLLTHLEDAGAALDLVEEILHGQGAAEHDGVFGLLDRIFRIPGYQERSAKLLEPIHQASGNWSGLIAMWEEQRRIAEAARVGSGAPFLARIAGIQEQGLKNRAAALATWRRILESDLESAQALGEIVRLATALETFDVLASIYEDLAARRRDLDIDGVAGLLVAAAGVRETRLGDKAGAARLWRRVLDLDPAHQATARPAAEALERALGELGDHRGLAEVLRAKADWTTRSSDRTELLLRIAAIEDKTLGDSAAAAATYRTLLEDDPGNIAVLGELDRLYGVLHRSTDQVEVLQQILENETRVPARAALRHRIAGILERDLQDSDGAVFTIRSLLDDSGEDVEALATLDRLYENKGASFEGIEVMSRRLRVVTDPGLRLSILRRMGNLLQGPLGQANAALERWREVLAIVPGDAEAVARIGSLLGHDDAPTRLAAAEILEPIAQKAGDWAGLARVIEVHIGAEPQVGSRLAHRIRLAELREVRLGDRAGAALAYAQAIAEGARGGTRLGDLMDSYERLAASTGPEQEATVAKLYRDVEGEVTDVAAKTRMARVVAMAAARVGGAGIEVALRYYEKALEGSPGDERTWQAIEDLHRAAGDWEALYGVLLRRAGRADNQDTAAEAKRCRQLGEAAAHLGRTQEAIAAYERVRVLDANHADASLALEPLYAETHRWQDLVQLLELSLAQGGPGADEAATIGTRFRLAQVEAGERQNPARAIEHLREVLAQDPDHAGAAALLETLVHDAEVSAGAADLLEPGYVRRGEWARLVALCEARLEHGGSAADRLMLCKRIARLYDEQIEDMDAAFTWYGKSLREGPRDQDVLSQLTRLGPKVDRWKDLYQVVSELVQEHPANDPEILALVRLAALTVDIHLKNRRAARAHYARYIEAQPGNPEASVVFEAALERWQAWKETRDFLDGQALRAVSGEARAEFLWRASVVNERRLKDPVRAVAALRGALDAHPTHAAALSDLERIYEQLEDVDLRLSVAGILEPHHRRAGDKEKLAGVLAVLVDSKSGADARAGTWREIADLEMQLGRLERAFEARAQAWQEDIGSPSALESLQDVASQADMFPRLVEVLRQGAQQAGSADMDLRGSLWGLVARLCEGRLGDDQGALEAWRHVVVFRPGDVEALSALEQLLTAFSQWEELATVLQQHAEATAAPADRADVLAQLADVYEDDLHDPAKAIASWRAVLRIDEKDEDALEALARLLSATEAWSEAVEVLGRQIDLAPDAAARRALHLAAAAILDEHLNDSAGALGHLRAVVSDNPIDGEAMAAWDRILTREGRHAELLRILDLRATVAKDDAGKTELALRAARTAWRDIGDFADAIERYERLIASAPDHPGALEELAAVCEERHAGTTDPVVRRDLGWRLANLYEEKLGQPERVVEFLRDIAAEPGPGDEARALARLEGLLGSLERNSELAEVLLREAELATAREAQAAFLSALGVLRLKRLDDIEGAVEAMSAVLERQPGNATALETLREILRDPGHMAAAAGILEQAARARGDFEEVARLCEMRAASEEDATARAEYLRRLAGVLADDMGDPTSAVEVLGQALKEHPASGSIIDDLERLGRQAAFALPAAQQIELALAGGEGGAAIAQLALRAAGLLAVGDEETRERLLLRAREADPENVEALRGLEAIYNQQGSANLLAQNLEQQGRLENDAERRGSFYAAAARLHEQAGDVAAAIAAWQAAAAQSGNLGVLGELERLYEASGQIPDLIAVLEERARLEQDPTRQAATFVRIGQLHLDTGGDLEAGAVAFHEALDLVPGHVVAHAQLQAIEESREDWNALEDLLLRQLDAGNAAGEADKVALLFRLSDNARDRLADAGKSIDYLTRIVEMDPANQNGLASLERELGAAERWHDLIEILERRLHAETGGRREEAGVRRLAIARIWADRIGDAARAKEYIESVLADDSGHMGALLALADVAGRTGDWATSTAALDRATAAAKTQGQLAEIHVRKGRAVAAAGGEASLVQPHYLAALDANPANREALAALESLARDTSNPGQLVQVLQLREHAARNDEERKALLREIAALYSGPLAMPAEAVPPLRRLAALTPADMVVHEELGQALASAGHVEEAEAVLEPLAAEASRSMHPKIAARLHQRLGLLAERRAGWARATECFEEAHRMDPSDPATQAALARLAMRQNDATKARRYLRSLLLQDFNEKAVGISKAEIYLALGRLHLAANEMAKARNMFERGLESEPENQEIQEQLRIMAT